MSESSSFEWKTAYRLLDQVMLRDQHRLRKLLAGIKQKQQTGVADTGQIERFQGLVAASCRLREERAQSIPVQIEFPDNLPVSAKVDEIGKAIRDHQVVVIAGATGSGKTTQIPKICLALGRGRAGLIGHTQPRRLAARTVAARIAEELKTPLGEGVGYQVRFTDTSTERTWIKLMTDGVLLAEIQNDRFLSRYDTLIIDEAHERSLNIDFLLGYLKQLLPKRPELKLIITSATIDVERFSAHFDQAPVIEVSGRTFPVDVLYRPLDELGVEGDPYAAILAGIEELITLERHAPHLETGGDILVFLAGEREIREAALFLRKADLLHCEVLPLYSRLSVAEQNRVFDTSGRRGRRIVLATNIAETSLTVPGIRYVIDPGDARISRYSFRTKVQRLPIEPISQSSAEQRKGRCGRVAHGVCVRLYSEQDFLGRPEFTDAEIHRTNLAAVILQMLSLRLGDIDRFPFIDPPDRRMVNDGRQLLQELGALAGDGQLNALGKQLARLPVDPRIGRMIVAAAEMGSLKEMLVIASALSIQDVRERPADKQQAADQLHLRFHEPQSDFLSLIKLWDYLEQQRQALTRNQLQKLCSQEFFSFMRLREWREVHFQLRLICQELKLKENHDPADYMAVHRAVLSGLLSHIGFRHEERRYLGARNRQFRIFPGSGVNKQSPKWVVAAELVETTQLYARTVAKIEPEWLVGLADHLFSRSYHEPHWSKQRGQVTAYEKVTLYGLLVSDRRKVDYGPINALEAREIFIRAALVEQQWSFKCPVIHANRRMIADILELEAKARRRDLLVDDQQIFAFYDARIPADICSAISFEAWARKPGNAEHLRMPREALLAALVDGLTEAQFPDTVSWNDTLFRIKYRFEPGQEDDGLSVQIPLAVLNRVPRYRFEWLVPGMLGDKCAAMIKALPKQWRKHFVPVPEAVARVLVDNPVRDEPLGQALGQRLHQLYGVKVPEETWREADLDAYYRANFQILDEHGKRLGQGRNLDRLIEQYRPMVKEQLATETRKQSPAPLSTRWSFGELPAVHEFKQAGQVIKAYPALVDNKEGVSVALFDYPEEAAATHRWGLVRLLMLSLSQPVKYLRRELLRQNTTQLKLANLGEPAVIIEELIQATVNQVFLSGDVIPQGEQAFNHCLQQHRAELIEAAQANEKVLIAVLDHLHVINKALKSSINPALLNSYSDIRSQLTGLIYPGFILRTPQRFYAELPRYLQAIRYRLERMGGQVQKDKQMVVELAHLTKPLQDLLASRPDALQRYPEVSLYRWMLEEYRVSLFAQPLGTCMQVSAKRLQQQWQMAKQSLP